MATPVEQSPPHPYAGSTQGVVIVRRPPGLAGGLLADAWPLEGNCAVHGQSRSSKWGGRLNVSFPLLQQVAGILRAGCHLRHSLRFPGPLADGPQAETLAEINRVVSNYSATPIPYTEIKEQFDALDPPEREWTQVELSGSYDVDGQRVVRNRPLNGQPGYDVVVPFRLTTGEAVVIDRGWLPIGNNTPGRPDVIPAPPTGEVTVVARLKPAEPKLDRGGAVDGQLALLTWPDSPVNFPIPSRQGGRTGNWPAKPPPQCSRCQRPSPNLPPKKEHTFPTHCSGSLLAC